MNEQLLGKLTKWNYANLARLTVLSLLFSALLFISIVIPYINITLSPQAVFSLIIFGGLIIFQPMIFLLIKISVTGLVIALIATLFNFREIAQYLGDLIYLLFWLIFIQLAKQLISEVKASKR